MFEFPVVLRSGSAPVPLRKIGLQWLPLLEADVRLAYGALTAAGRADTEFGPDGLQKQMRVSGRAEAAGRHDLADSGARVLFDEPTNTLARCALPTDRK